MIISDLISYKYWPNLWAKAINWRYIRHLEDVQDVLNVLYQPDLRRLRPHWRLLLAGRSAMLGSRSTMLCLRCDTFCKVPSSLLQNEALTLSASHFTSCFHTSNGKIHDLIKVRSAFRSWTLPLAGIAIGALYIVSRSTSGLRRSQEGSQSSLERVAITSYLRFKSNL